MNRRISERFDVVEQQIIALDARIAATEAGIVAKVGALQESIGARDFRLDDHGRHLTTLEESAR